MSARQRRRRKQRRTDAADRLRGRSKRAIAGAGITLGAGLAFAASAQADVETFTVNSLDDGPADTCTAAAEGCTLRDAVAASEDGDTTDLDTIVFDSSITGSPGTIPLAGSQLPIVTEPLYVDGPGSDVLEVSGYYVGGSSRIFSILAGGDVPVTIEGLTLSDGDAGPGGGGAVRIEDAVTGAPEPDLTVKNSEVSGNSAGQGGGLYGFRASITVQNSQITDNTTGTHAYTGGGGIYEFSGVTGTVTIQNSVISDNSTKAGTNARGGGVNSVGAATIQDSVISGNYTMGDYAVGGGLFLANDSTIENSTIYENHTEGDHASGGGIATSAFRSTTISGSTIYGNYTLGGDADGGGLFSPSGYIPTVESSTVYANSAEGANGDGDGLFFNQGEQPTIRNSTVAGNDGDGIYTAASSPAPVIENTILADNAAADLFSPDDTFGVAFSLVEDPGAPITETVAGSNKTGVDPQLGPLADNGGPTDTLDLPITSPAIDAGSSSATADQRGLLRAVNTTAADSTAAGANCADMGAFELQLGGGGPGDPCQASPPPPPGGATPPAPAPTKKKKCKKKHKRSATSAKKKCKKKKK